MWHYICVDQAGFCCSFVVNHKIYDMSKLHIAGDSLEIIYCAPRPIRAESTVDYSNKCPAMQCLPYLNHVHTPVQCSSITFLS